MTFRPIIPLGGLAGWNLLNRTLDAQKSLQENSPVVKRELTYFRENISKVSSAEELVADRTLLKVSLGAFGLQDDLPNKFFIRKVLEGGVLEQGSLANKLSDPRYAAISKSFGFGDLGIPRTSLRTFPDEILKAYKDQSFEVSVGETNPDMRLALGLQRELENVVASATSADARWFGVMGSPPLRAIFETALNLPESFASVDIDQQLRIFRERSEAIMGAGEVADFTVPDRLDQLRDRFLLVAEIKRPAVSQATSPVLTLFSGPSGAASILGAVYSGTL